MTDVLFSGNSRCGCDVNELCADCFELFEVDCVEVISPECLDKDIDCCACHRKSTRFCDGCSRPTCDSCGLWDSHYSGWIWCAVCTGVLTGQGRPRRNDEC
jgi:hypothetical protein